MSVAYKLMCEGKKEGKIEGAYNMVVKQIEKKMGITISDELEKKFKEVDHETLEKIGENIFQIEDKQDIWQLL